MSKYHNIYTSNYTIVMVQTQIIRQLQTYPKESLSTHLHQILMVDTRHHINFPSKTILKGNSFFQSTPTMQNFNRNNPISIPGKLLTYNYINQDSSCQQTTWGIYKIIQLNRPLNSNIIFLTVTTNNDIIGTKVKFSELEVL